MSTETEIPYYLAKYLHGSWRKIKVQSNFKVTWQKPCGKEGKRFFVEYEDALKFSQTKNQAIVGPVLTWECVWVENKKNQTRRFGSEKECYEYIKNVTKRLGKGRNEYTISEGTVKMELTQGEYVKFDEIDLIKVLENGPWYADKKRRCYYAASNLHHKGSKNKHDTIYMHRLLCPGEPADETYTVDHVDSSDSLNNSRSNLRWVEKRIQSLNRRAAVRNSTEELGITFVPEGKTKSRVGDFNAQFRSAGGLITRRYSIGVYGKEVALKLARAARRYMTGCRNREEFQSKWRPLENQMILRMCERLESKEDGSRILPHGVSCYEGKYVAGKEMQDTLTGKKVRVLIRQGPNQTVSDDAAYVYIINVRNEMEKYSTKQSFDAGFSKTERATMLSIMTSVYEKNDVKQLIY